VKCYGAGTNLKNKSGGEQGGPEFGGGVRPNTSLWGAGCRKKLFLYYSKEEGVRRKAWPKGNVMENLFRANCRPMAGIIFSSFLRSGLEGDHNLEEGGGRKRSKGIRGLGKEVRLGPFLIQLRLVFLLKYEAGGRLKTSDRSHDTAGRS